MHRAIPPLPQTSSKQYT